jgi:hypothetical protein
LGYPALEEDVARLSPFVRERLNACLDTLLMWEYVDDVDALRCPRMHPTFTNRLLRDSRM